MMRFTLKHFNDTGKGESTLVYEAEEDDHKGNMTKGKLTFLLGRSGLAPSGWKVEVAGTSSKPGSLEETKLLLADALAGLADNLRQGKTAVGIPSAL